jgi:hypothetical protein
LKPLCPPTVNICVVKQAAHQYSTLNYLPELVELLHQLCPEEEIGSYSKKELHQRLSSILIDQYRGEQQFKYFLFKNFSNQDVIAAFEMRVNGSRADFLTINGVSNSFEIKSGLDNLDKLGKQCADYIQVFDYNHVVIDSNHLKKVKEIVPPSFGIWSFKDADKEVHRTAKRNMNIEPEMQLRLLTKKELTQGFRELKGNPEEILRFFSKKEINERFKKILKSRYMNRWNFLLSHKEAILPLDLQFFFHTNIDPSLIYNS